MCYVWWLSELWVVVGGVEMRTRRHLVSYIRTRLCLDKKSVFSKCFVWRKNDV